MPFREHLREQVQLVRRKQISPSELLELHLQQIQAFNPIVNAFSILLADEARAAVRQCESTAVVGSEAGPLRGVPLTVKDSFDVAGHPTLAGSRLRIGHEAPRDASAVQRLRSAGAIILGKTNTPELLRSYETDNRITGRTNNPWDPSRTPGGSSGGQAAAIASYCSPGGIGSDGGGSIRVPAHFCGIAGLKPTPGRISVSGHFPAISNPGGFASVVGPMARTVDDLKLLFDVLAAHDPEDPYSVPVTPATPARGLVPIGYWHSFYNVPVSDPVSAALERAAKLLESIGHPVDLFQPTGSERAPNVWRFVFSELPAEFLSHYFRGREGDTHWTSTEFGSTPPKPPVSGTDVLNHFAARDRLRTGCIQQMVARNRTVLLMPVCGTSAFVHRQRSFETSHKPIGLFEAMMPSLIWNLYGFPALTVPMDISPDGLPVGIQLVGLPWSDEILLDIGHRLELARGPMPSPPALAQSTR